MRTFSAWSTGLLLGLTVLATGCPVEHGGLEPDPERVVNEPTGPENPIEENDPEGEDNGSKDPQPEPDAAPEPDATPEPDAAPEPDAVVEPEPEPEPTMAESTRHNLVWKRYRAVENDLMRAMQLNKSQLCMELGQFPCVDLVHLAPLGGNEPFDLGQYEPVGAPTATTPIANDRVVLSACATRIDLDKSGNAAVFTDLDLNKASLSLDTDGSAIDATTTMLYRCLLSRDPTEAETNAVRGLVDEAPISAEEFAKASCYAIGTTVENFFY